MYITTENLNSASWGELMTATAKMRGAVGAVLNGFHRDTPQVLEQNWPVFSRGRYAQDASVRSAVVDYAVRYTSTRCGSIQAISCLEILTVC